MSKLEEDIRKAIEITKCPHNKFDEMKEFSKIYQNTSENIKLYMPFLKGDYKKALLPTASGDHQLEAILIGINNITCFDLNRLARYFSELKFGAIKNLTREEYIYFMYEDMLNKNIFDFFKNSLDEDISIFWEELYKNCNIEYIRTELFRYLGCTKSNHSIKGIDFSKYCAENFTRYLEKENYKLIQDRLQNTNIEYIESNLLNLPTILNDNYDLINLTNIYEYINKDIIYGGAERFINVFKDLISYLNDNGKILLTYLYRCDLNDIKKYGNKGFLYLQILFILENSMLGYWHDIIANKKNKKTTMDKCYAFRNAQLLRYIKCLNIDLHELDGVGIGCGKGNKDMVLVYKKI